MNRNKLLSAILAALLILACGASCGKGTGNTPADSAVTEARQSDTAVKDSATVAGSENTTSPVTIPETQAPATGVSLSYGVNCAGRIINPLTGLAGTETLTKQRPVAVMVNNIKVSMPQNGISKADVIYEFMAEGGITRLMMLSADYASLPTIGSVRSARKCFIDAAQNHDAIFVHIGASDEAFQIFTQRKIDHLDAISAPAPGVFWQDEWRKQNMPSSEHTWVTSGPAIVSGIAYRNYRTEIKSDIDSPFDFVDYEAAPVVPEGSAAASLKVVFNGYQAPEFKYDETTQTYKRWQYGTAHIDGTTGEQLAFTNVLILSCVHTDKNDDKNHVDVDMTGTGEGYYISEGVCQKIIWSKSDPDAQVSYKTEDGAPLIINCGKTFIEVVSPYVFQNGLTIG